MKFQITLLLIMITSILQAQEKDFSAWDENEDGLISKEEFMDEFDDWEYDEWDSNDDEILDFAEWNANASGLYDDEELYYDFDRNGDNYVNEKEYALGTFNLWDDDDNGFLNEGEYNAYIIDLRR